MSGLPVKTGLRAPVVIGTVDEQLSRLDHARDAHGLRPLDCEVCGGAGLVARLSEDHRLLRDCEACGGNGATFEAGDLEPCGPDCPLRALLPS